jgi:site-specific recombinase XerD
MADTGLRRGEIAGMMLDDLDLADSSISVHDTKNHSSRSVYLTERVVGAIMCYVNHMGTISTAGTCGGPMEWRSAP